ncbi:hypothetical protein [Streptomyces bauhiniae]|uniref:hypothetical protein n=1 Tax=Streptomyces bauhiniae TaxID=2340725 RepID=UPI003D280CCA
MRRWQLGARQTHSGTHVLHAALRRGLPVDVRWMTLPEAKEFGALALFDETYGDMVRVVEIGGAWSRELCGGTHVQHASQIGVLALTSESPVGSGGRKSRSRPTRSRPAERPPGGRRP